MTEPGDGIVRPWEPICMLSRRRGGDIRSRAMAAHAEPFENVLHVLTDVAGHKDKEIERRHNVGPPIANSHGQNYVSVTGEAAVSNDRARICDLWSTPIKAWWEDAGDPLHPRPQGDAKICRILE